MSAETPDARTVEYLDESTRRRGDGRRWALIGAGTAGAVGIVAAGAWGVSSFMGGSTAPASAVPAGALAYLAVDLDPAGDQKLEAHRTLSKFPALKKELRLEEGGDLRRALFDALAEGGGCDLDFERDVDPWLGSRMAMSVVPGEKEPVPFVVLEVDDPDAVEIGLGELATCGGRELGAEAGSGPDKGADDYGVAFVGDYAVVAETRGLAEDVARDAEAGPLEQDAAFQRWVGEAGGAGIVTGYIAAEAADVALDAMSDALLPEVPPTGMSSLPHEQLEQLAADFEGAAVVARFDGGALEVQSATGGLSTSRLLGHPTAQAAGDGGLSALPGTTAAAYGFAVSDTFAADMVEAFSQVTDADSVERSLAQAERQTGLELPEDLQTLLGDGVSLALDSSADVAGWAEGTGTERVAAGVRIVGDPDRILPILDKLRAAGGPGAEKVVVESGDKVVAIGLDPDYVATLAGDGDLGDQQRFQDALPELADSTGGLYVDFDAGDWLDQLVKGEPDAAGLRANLEPLGSLGITSRLEDGVAHGLVRLTTD